MRKNNRYCKQNHYIIYHLSYREDHRNMKLYIKDRQQEAERVQQYPSVFSNYDIHNISYIKMKAYIFLLYF